jgi:hypothetical protein
VWWWVAAIAVVVLVGVYVVWVSGRIDRSHARAAAAQAALDAHLVRRAAAAVDAAEAAGDAQLRWAAKVALEADAEEREAAENDLTRSLRVWFAGAGGVPLVAAPGADTAGSAAGRRPPDAPGGDGAVGAVPPGPADLVRASRRVALARQVHNDLVRDALALRRRRLVRVLRLARKHPLPAYFDIDDPAPGRT